MIVLCVMLLDALLFWGCCYCVIVCVLFVYTRSSSTGGHGLGPTQVKRHLEKQAELLSEARRILENELEILQVSSYVRQ